MNPTLQVAFVSVLATTITTLGVIAVAIINQNKERAKTQKILDNSGIVASYDEKSLEEVLDRLLALISENERKETTIRNLRKRVRVLTDEVTELKTQIPINDDS